jgi:VanZ family protein
LLGALPTGGGGYHVVAYFVLALGFSFSSAEPRIGRIIAAVAAYGALLELLQFLVPGRTPEMIDLVANSVGAILGAAVSQIILRRWSLQ